MNRAFLLILIFLLPVGLTGQVNYSSDLYNLDKLIINPAFAGSKDALSITALYRNQWTGFENSPKNYSVSAHAPLHNDRMGLGLFIEKSSLGIFKETNIMANYAYNMELSKGRLSFGLGIGATICNIAWNELVSSVGGDLLLMNEPVNTVLPNVSIGTYYFTRKYFIGFSLPFLLSHEINDISGEYHTAYDLNNNIFHLTGGYNFVLNPQLRLSPSMLFKYRPAGEVQIDCNFLLSLKERLSVGLGYRNHNTMIAMIDVMLNPQIRMAYAYDFDLSPLSKYKGGSHEIGINYIFCYQRNIASPRQF
jgi:type IX secretion system PorP/SprF family membrane protein